MSIKYFKNPSLFYSTAFICAIFASMEVSAKVVILEAETQIYEIPRSQIKTYIQKATLEQNLRPVKAIKPGSVSDEELLAIPEKYLPPELKERQKQIRDQKKISKKRKELESYTPGIESDFVKIKGAKDKILSLKIDEAVWVPPTAASLGAILAPQRKLPDVEVLQELKIETSGEVRKEIKAGEAREIDEYFQNGQTQDANKKDLLAAYKAYKDRDFASSTTLSLSALSDAKNDDLKINARYLLSHSLFQAGFYASALTQLVELSSTKLRRSAVGMAALALEKTRDDGAANQILSKISLSQIPTEHQALFSFHLGRILMNTGAREASLAAFKRVSSDHIRYPEAQYYMGVIRSAEISSSVEASDWEKEGSMVNRARLHFESALVSAKTQSANDLVNLLNISLARLAYQTKQYNQSIFFYNEVGMDSPFVKDASYESSWSLYRLGEFNRSLGLLHPIGSKYFESRDLAEIWILRSLNYLKLCRFNEATHAANQFEVTLKNTDPDLQADANKIKVLALSRASQLQESDLSDWVKKLLLSDSVVKKDLTREALLLKERAELNALRKNLRIDDEELKNSSAQVLEGALDRKVAAIGTAIKPYLISRVSDIIDEYKTQRGRLDFLRFEIYNQATKFPKALERPEAQKLIAKGEFLPGVFLKGRETLWKFNGEYWFDELKGYDFFIPTECRSEI